MAVDKVTKRTAVDTAEGKSKRARVTANTDGGELPQRPCAVGRPAPQFSAPAVQPDSTFTRLSLGDFNGRYLILLFYPRDFTFVCPTELTAFSDRLSEFTALNCALVACSTDSEFAHYNWRQQARRDGGVGELSMPMLADRTHAVSRAYNVLCEESGDAFRGLFVIDRSQTLRIAMVNDMPVGRSVDEALRLVEALKFADEHGEVCPANWRAGQPTIKPEISASKSFFAQI
ncbi:Peroxiredoxin-1 [Coemansia erecta]|nr:Peroxiredoxin-1 [Coemansia sp. RSA 2618]KAJ2828104.1 Peroxiredoxin-1 [Coemansia erecta]